MVGSEVRLPRFKSWSYSVNSGPVALSSCTSDSLSTKREKYYLPPRTFMKVKWDNMSLVFSMVPGTPGELRGV